MAGGPEKKLRTLSVMCEKFKYPESSGSMHGSSPKSDIKELKSCSSSLEDTIMQEDERLS